MNTERKGLSDPNRHAWRRLRQRYRARKALHRPLPWLGYAFVAVNLIALALLVLDAPLAEGAARLSPVLIDIARAITDIGRLHWLLFLTALVLAVVFWMAARDRDARRRFRLALAGYIAGYMTVTLLLASLAGQLLKFGIGRARPPLFGQYGLLGFEPFRGDFLFMSFPSGHATHLGAFFAAACFLLPKGRPLFLAAALWLAATRVIIGVHYPSDVTAGLALGVWTALAVAYIFARCGLVFSIAPSGWPDLRLRHPFRRRRRAAGLVKKT